jgi:SPP1 gp7 family putative phage head morphogenesis protein
MPDPLVIRIVRQHKQELIDREEAQMSRMTREWLKVERALHDRIIATAQRVQDLRDAGQEVPEWRLWELRHFQGLVGQLRVEMDRYAGFASGLIADEQAYLGELGMNTAQQVLTANGVYAWFTELPVAQIEAMAGSTGAGTPLRTLLEDSWPVTSQRIADELMKSIALGLNPRATARAMRNGMGVGLGRALTIARTEQIRVYRTSSLLSYRASGVVEGYLRMAAHDLRTCLGCLALEGTFYTLGQPLGDHPRGRCSMIPKLFNRPAVEFMNGESWVNGLPEDQQLALLGEERMRLWKSGQVPFSRFGKTVPNETWGDSVQVTSLSQLRGPLSLLTYLRR